MYISAFLQGHRILNTKLLNQRYQHLFEMYDGCCVQMVLAIIFLPEVDNCFTIMSRWPCILSDTR